VGLPSILTENFDFNFKYFGIIKCKLLPPKGLYIPVIPIKTRNKLVFPLCFTCAINDIQVNCNHNSEERALTGTWCTLEVDKAILKGYKLLEIYEVWHWEKREKYDPIKKTGGIFTNYINMALKLKQEASGYPSNCITDEDKDNYIKDFFEHEGVTLNKENIAYNSIQRLISKLIANSMWGRLALNRNSFS
jgi:hypothetical protein